MKETDNRAEDCYDKELWQEISMGAKKKTARPHAANNPPMDISIRELRNIQSRKKKLSTRILEKS